MLIILPPYNVVNSNLKTLLLMHMDGANNGTIFINSANDTQITNPTTFSSITTTGITSSNAFKFGSTSAIFRRSTANRMIRVNNAPTKNFNGAFGTDDFTIEAWVNPSVNAAEYQTIMATRTTYTSSIPSVWALGYHQLMPYFFSDKMVLQAGSLPLNTWSHVAVVRFNGILTMYVNGMAVATSTSIYNFTDDSQFTIGGNTDGSEPINQGYVDEVRVSKIARYTGNFTPPNNQFAPD